jgi:MFS transporter, DHA2 family, multidrug resistance protein
LNPLSGSRDQGRKGAAACLPCRSWITFFAGSHRSDSAVATATALFTAHPTGAGDPALQGLAGIGNLIRREAYGLAYIDRFWIIAWVMAAGIVLLLLLHPPPPNPLTPPRSDL